MNILISEERLKAILDAGEELRKSVLWPIWDENKAVAASNAWLLARYLPSENQPDSRDMESCGI